MDIEWAKAKVADFIAALDADQRQHRPGHVERPTRDDVVRRVNAVHQIALAVNQPTLANEVAKRHTDPFRWEFKDARDGAAVLLSILEEQEELEAGLGGTSTPAGPLDGLHPRVKDAAGPLWEAGHARAAVAAAGTAVEEFLKEKLNDQRDATHLVTAFKAQAPRDVPSLRFPGLVPDSNDFRSAQDGAHHLGRACLAFIRNRTVHNTAEVPAPTATDMLGTLSLFARAIDQAEVVPPPD